MGDQWTPPAGWPDPARKCSNGHMMTEHRDYGQDHTDVIVLSCPRDGWCAFPRSGGSYNDAMEPEDVCFPRDLKFAVELMMRVETLTRELGERTRERDEARATNHREWTHEEAAKFCENLEGMEMRDAHALITEALVRVPYDAYLVKTQRLVRERDTLQAELDVAVKMRDEAMAARGGRPTCRACGGTGLSAAAVAGTSVNSAEHCSECAGNGWKPPAGGG